jgi:isopentenyldiphosphate isomerase
MEILDIVDESGSPTGRTVSREQAHRDGILHRTAHVWVVREKDGRTQVLLQKRSAEKDSFPDMYDTSSAGHIPAGEEPLPSAIRELKEELGISAVPDELHEAGSFRIQYEKVFHGRPFRDNEVCSVFVYREPLEIKHLTLQASEVSEVRWFDLKEIRDEIERGDRHRLCVPAPGLQVLIDWLGNDIK